MNWNLDKMVKQLYNTKIKRRRKFALLSLLSFIVLASTFYVLAFPAITAEKPKCGIEEHIHTGQCYERVLKCNNPDHLEAGSIICEHEGVVIHTHDSNCYNDNGELICNLDEVSEHIHDDSCFAEEKELVCDIEESLAHVHDDSCYAEDKVLTCTEDESEGHSHDDSCYDEEGNVICGMDESEGHSHDENCYTTEKVIVCQEDTEIEGHVHDDSCYNTKLVPVCGQDEIFEHKHTDECYLDGELNCGHIEAVKHQHDSSCFVPEKSIEGEVGQITTPPGHTDECYETKLICNKEEHTHTDECYDEEVAGGGGGGRPDEERPSLGDYDFENDMENHEEDESFAIAYKPSFDEEQSLVNKGVSMLMSFMAKNSPEGADIAKDFTDWITDVKIQKKDGDTWIDATDIYFGDIVRCIIEYKVPKDEVNVENPYIKYQIPEGLIPNADMEGKVLSYDSSFNPIEVGNYWITDDGLILIKFYDAFIKDGESFRGDVSFQGKMEKEDGEGGYEIDFGFDGEAVNVGPKPVKKDFTVSKSGVQGENNTVNYTVTISSENGTNDSINITDTFSFGKLGISYNDGSFQIIKTNADGVTENVTGLYTVTINPPQDKISSGSFTINGLAPLEAGEKYDIKYTITHTPVSESGEGNGEITIKNTASVTSGEDTREAVFEFFLSKKMIEKTGYQDMKNNSIVWIIDINKDLRDISGYTVYDHLPEGLYVTGDIEIKNNSDNTSVTIKEFPYTFPEGSNDWYTVTFRTAVSDDIPQGAYKEYTNKAELIKDNDTYSSDYTVKYNNNSGLKKEFLGNYKPIYDGWGTESGEEYQWKTTIYLPENGITKDTKFEYTDTMGEYLWTKADESINMLDIKKVTSDGRSVSLKSNEYSVEYYDAKGNICKSEEDDVKSFKVIFKTDIDNSFERIELTYYTYADYSEIPEGENFTFVNKGNVVIGENTHNVESTHDYEKIAPVKKVPGYVDENGDIQYTVGNMKVDFDKSDRKLYYKLIVNSGKDKIGDITVTDTLPEGTKFNSSDCKFSFVLSDGSESNTIHIDGSTYDVNDIADFSYDEDKNKVEFKFRQGQNKFEFTVKYSLSFDEDSFWDNAANSEKGYENIVITDGYETSITQTVKREDIVIMKIGEQGPEGEGNRIKYNVTINPSGDDLLTDEHVLKLIDTIEIDETEIKDISLISETVKLYRYDSSLPNHKGNEISKDEYSVSYDSKLRKLEVTVPDETPCILEYEYFVNPVSNQETFEILNKANLVGVGNVEDDENIIFDTSKSNASAIKSRVVIKKVDSENMSIVLPGAKFKIKGYDINSNQWIYVGDEYTTDKNGEIIFNIDDNSSIIKENTLYMIEEITPPDGYQIISPAYAYFTVGKGSIQDVKNSMRETVEKAGIPVEDVNYFTEVGGSIYFENENAAIMVEKKWQNESGEEIEAPVEYIEVNLMRKIQGALTGELIETVRLSEENQWKYSWNDLPKFDSNGNRIYYYIEELNVPDGFEVSYSVSSDGVLSGTITVINKFKSAGFDIIKVDETDSPLYGVVFKLYKADDSWNQLGDPIKTITTDTNGKAVFDNLSRGKYLLYETETLAGYEKPENPWKIEIVENKDTNKLEVKFVESPEGPLGVIEAEKINSNPSNPENDLYKIVNHFVTPELPQTGGEGKYIYTISGILFMVGALTINSKIRKEG